MLFSKKFFIYFRIVYPIVTFFLNLFNICTFIFWKNNGRYLEKSMRGKTITKQMINYELEIMNNLEDIALNYCVLRI